MENLKDALSTLIKVAEKTDNALIDGKINIAEGVSIAMSAIGLIKVIKNAKELFAEYQTLSDEQLTNLSIWFAQEFDIQNDNVEEIIEMVFTSILTLGTVLENLK